MYHVLYNTALRLASPGVRLGLRCSRRHGALTERFAPSLPDFDQAPLWVHACSVGEVNTALPIVSALEARFPGVPIVLSTSTVSGHDLAKKRSEVPVVWCPFDHPRAVRGFLERLRPRCLVLVETELWPNLVRQSHASSIPVVVVNGRLSNKHFPRYTRWARLWRPVFSALNAVGAQSEAYRDRFVSLGVPPERVQVTGSTKFDSVKDAVPSETRSRLRAACGIPRNAPVLVFGSTRPGDEALAAECSRTLRDQVPDLRVVVAPRHVKRGDAVCACFEEPVLRRSNPSFGQGARVIVVDTLGELIDFYAIASVAVVGGSFYPGVDGHNPLEPCALGVPTLFGPYMANFQEPAEVLLAAEGAVRLDGPDGLTPALLALLRDPAEQRRLGTRARRAVLQHRGAVGRNVDLVAGVLAASRVSV